MERCICFKVVCVCVFFFLRFRPLEGTVFFAAISEPFFAAKSLLWLRDGHQPEASDSQLAFFSV